MSTTLSQGAEYGFALGRARSIETQLLDRGRYDRLVKTRNSDEFAAVLMETVYSRHFDAGDSGNAAVGTALARAHDDNFGFFAQYATDGWLLDLFRLPADIHNLKVTLKRVLGRSEGSGDGLVANGSWSRETLAALAAAEPDARPIATRAAAIRVRELYRTASGSALVDTTLDRLGQELAMDLARGSAFLTGYLGLHADLENLRTAVRTRVSGDDPGMLGHALLPGGTIGGARLAEALATDISEFAARLSDARFRAYLDDSLAYLARHRSLLRMERRQREIELDFLMPMRYVAFGYEPLVAFYLERENEIRNLRQLSAATSSGMTEDEKNELVVYAR
jgi:V/A-type H+/Na+-transporting ATPase subunit C